MGSALLVDRYGRAQPFDVIYVGLLHPAQELARVRGQGFHIASLSFGVYGVKRQRALAGPGRTGYDHQFVPGDDHVDVLEIVLSCAPDYDVILRHVSVTVSLRTRRSPSWNCTMRSES